MRRTIPGVTCRFTAVAVALLLCGCSLMRDPPEPTFGRDDALAITTGESFVVLSGADYEIFVFESGRVMFNGKPSAARQGVVERQTMPSVYYELKKLIAVRSALSRRLHFGCRAGHPGFHVGAVEGQRVRAGYLNYGCFNQVDDLDALTAAFIRAADAAALIGKIDPGYENGRHR